MLEAAVSWQTIVSEVEALRPDLHHRSREYKHLILAAAEKRPLSPHQVNQLAHHLNLKLYPKPSNLPEDWKYFLCKSYLAQRYRHPSDSREYVVVMPPSSIGYRPYVIHRTRIGYADPRWFYEVVPQLEKIIKDPTVGDLFSRKFNRTLNSLCENAPGGMTMGQVQAINLFFEQYVPGVTGLCPVCFKVSLPRGGAGKRWRYRHNEDYEVRISAAKPDADHACQQRVYVSHTEVSDENKRVHARWDEKTGTISFDPEMRQETTHIPWEAYDFDKFSFKMPGCQCKKKF